MIRPANWPAWSGYNLHYSTKPTWPACWLKTCMGADVINTENNDTWVIQSWHFVQKRHFPVAKTVKNYWPLASGKELAAPSPRIPASTFGPSGLWALPRLLQLCPGNDPLRNFVVLAVLSWYCFVVKRPCETQQQSVS